MNNKTIDAKILSRMFLAGAKNLEAKKEWINELNVFPVPDGDTGTNMTLTIMSAAKDVAAMNANNDLDMKSLAKAISSGSLRGARGNSGVILSQLFRGFTKAIRDYDTIDIPLLAEACEKAVETAYKAVMKPKEGTILTVARAAADKAIELADGAEDLDSFFNGIFQHAEETLARTPEMLPVLKEAGVVDSGGQGLLEVFRGAIDGYHGKEVDYSQFEASAAPKITKISPQAEADIKFGYCTEFIILLEKEFTENDEHELKAYLSSIGDSIVCVADDEIVKIHVHTNDPGLAIQKALTYGQLSKMKIDNMREEHQERLIKDAEKVAAQQEEEKKNEPRKDYGFVAISVGEGLDEIFKGLGVDYIISGGQTMNPSTEDILEAVDKINADTIFVLPNNKNIILAAQQAESLVEDKKLVVIPSKTVPQGIAAMIGFVQESSVEENKESMIENMSYIKTGQSTYAVRDTVIDDKEIHEGNIMGIGDDGILSVGEDIADTTVDMIREMVDEESEIVSLYYGSDVTEDDANELAKKVEKALPDVEVEVYPGGQPIYYYIASVE